MQVWTLDPGVLNVVEIDDSREGDAGLVRLVQPGDEFIEPVGFALVRDVEAYGVNQKDPLAVYCSFECRDLVRC